jgi:hypothetical protein
MDYACLLIIRDIGGEEEVAKLYSKLSSHIFRTVVCPVAISLPTADLPSFTQDGTVRHSESSAIEFAGCSMIIREEGDMNSRGQTNIWLNTLSSLSSPQSFFVTMKALHPTITSLTTQFRRLPLSESSASTMDQLVFCVLSHPKGLSTRLLPSS